MDGHFNCLCIWKESWDTLDSNFWRPSWPPSWKICNYCYWFLHIWTLRPLFHMNRHFICLCIWTQSWDTLDSDFSAAILAAFLIFFILLILDIAQQYFTNRKSLKSDYYFHWISHLIEVILISRIGRHNGHHIGRHLEK